ncbi:MAG: LAGLIDADG family homing endonuclease, partial [Thermus sp.]|uniref:LAGLIDADG family homing endonuclease n=1 Tax=Thermus sp. TaxID=275 RepID=UPI0025FDD487
MSGANPQERLSGTEAERWFLAGFIEGEGSLCVSVKYHPGARYGVLVDPEFYIYQHVSGRPLLEMAQRVFGTGRIYPKPGNPQVLVFCIDARRSLKERVIPFLFRYVYPFSAKREQIR